MATMVILVNVGAVWSTGGHWLAIVSLAGAIWARGIASNFRRDSHNMPNYAVSLMLATGVIGIVMLIVGLSS
ncbi:MAG: hypothetical protein P8M16_08685 [Acidimicrobiales bacterium]|nr:hypothetical protein [Acidimicrobiales bacterium]